MDYTIALRFFAIMLTILCVTLATFLVRHDPLPVNSTIQIAALPRAQWSSILTRTGVMCMIASFVLLLAVCSFLLG